MDLTSDLQPGRLEVSGRAPLPEHHRNSLEYILISKDEAVIRKRREELRDSLKEWLLSNGEPDENGNLRYYFDKPVILEDQEVSGLMAQRRVSEMINEDVAFEVAEKYNVLDQVVTEVITTELDMDMLYVLNQQGVIPDEDIDSIFEFTETWALVKMEG